MTYYTFKVEADVQTVEQAKAFYADLLAITERHFCGAHKAGPHECMGDWTAGMQPSIIDPMKEET